jgi:hypothetical protein
LRWICHMTTVQKFHGESFVLKVLDCVLRWPHRSTVEELQLFNDRRYIDGFPRIDLRMLNGIATGIRNCQNCKLISVLLSVHAAILCVRTAQSTPLHEL